MRLAKPFWLAIGFAVLLIWLAGRIAFDTEVNQLPSLTQVLAHFTLTHDIFGLPAISAGVWYVAIDLQLFLMTMGLVYGARWVSARFGFSPAPLVVYSMFALTLLSLFWWNRNPTLDEWGWYFIGSYGLGFLAQWASKAQRRLWGSAVIALCLLGCLVIEWRERFLLTGLVALILVNHAQASMLFQRLASKPVQWLSDISYSVFLIHYGVAVLASAVVIELDLQGVTSNGLAFLLTWVAGSAAGWLLHWGVESRKQ